MKQSLNFMQKEQIMRKVTPIGNGAHIFAPKEWIGEQIFLVRLIKPSLKERILNTLAPHLEDIKGIYLYGSYARGEAEKESDIDLLVITNKKITIKQKDFEIVALEEESIPKALKISPILIYSALAEAKAILNSQLLEKLRIEYQPDETYFKSYLQETKNIIGINEESPDPYSVILRLRGIYIIQQLLEREIYTHKKFKVWIKNHLGDIDINNILIAYKKTKNNKKQSTINIKDLKQLLSFLRIETEKLESLLHGKKKKET